MPRAAKLSALALIMTVLSAMAWVTPAMALDTLRPDTTIDIGPFGVVGVDTAHFEFHADETSTFTCKLDLNSWSACAPSGLTGTKNYASLPDGLHTFQVKATDTAGNADLSPASRSWTVDTTPPNTTINSGPTGAVNNPDATFTFSSNEGGGTFECSLNGGGFTLCASPKSYYGLFDGDKTFAVRAIDQTAHVDATPAARAWTVDTTTPDTQITSGPSATPLTSTSATFTFVSPPVNTTPVTFQCSLDGAAFAACISPKTYVGPLVDGQHTFRVKAIDGVGLVDLTPDESVWTKDTTAPDTVIDTGPPANTNELTGAFTFHSTEANSTFLCDVDGGGYGLCASPFTTAPLAGNAQHTFSVKAVDEHGVPDGSPATRTWKIDSNPPDTAIFGGPGEGTTTDQSWADFPFASTEPGTFRCRLDGLPVGGADCATPAKYTSLLDGPHTFEVQAIDSAGNIDPTPATRNWIISGGDTSAPNVIIDTAPTGTTPDTTATLTFHATEASSTFECKLDTAAAFTACVSPKTYTGLAAGAHTFQVRATDSSHNTGAAATATWTIGLVPTTLTIKAPDSAKHGTRVTVSGVLKSDDPTCQSAQKVYLKAGTATLGPRTTSTTGAYSWSVYIGTSNKGVKAIYKGTTRCAASQSERLVITST